MATSSFTRKIVLGDKAVDKMIQILASDDTKVKTPVPEYSLNDKEFMEKCLGLSTYRK
jgi:hypothetical protein